MRPRACIVSAAAYTCWQGPGNILAPVCNLRALSPRLERLGERERGEEGRLAVCVCMRSGSPKNAADVDYSQGFFGHDRQVLAPRLPRFSRLFGSTGPSSVSEGDTDLVFLFRAHCVFTLILLNARFVPRFLFYAARVSLSPAFRCALRG